MPHELLDDVVITDEERASCVALARCVAGTVLEGGLGAGLTRDALIAAPAVAAVRTAEIDADVVARTMNTNRPDGSRPPPSAPGRTVEVADVRAVVAAEARKGGRSAVTALVLDVGSDILDDAAFWADARTLLSRPHSRVVMRSDRPVRVPGFVAYRLEDVAVPLQDVWTLDRWDPDNGVGVVLPRMRIPGEGWVAIPSSDPPADDEPGGGRDEGRERNG